MYLRSINTIGLSDELAEKVRAGLPVHVGDAFGNDQLTLRFAQALKEIDEHLMYGFRTQSRPDATLTIMLRPSGITGGISGGITGGIGGGSSRRSDCRPEQRVRND